MTFKLLYDLLLRTDESLTGLAAVVKELQEFKEHSNEDKMFKQQENERRDGEISQITQVRHQPYIQEKMY